MRPAVLAHIATLGDPPTSEPATSYESLTLTQPPFTGLSAARRKFPLDRLKET